MILDIKRSYPYISFRSIPDRSFFIDEETPDMLYQKIDRSQYYCVNFCTVFTGAHEGGKLLVVKNPYFSGEVSAFNITFA
jgi:hypothetical protein